MSVSVFNLNDDATCKWIDVIDPDENKLEELSLEYNLPRNVVIDCLDPDHLPKYEKHKDYTFIIVRFFASNPKRHVHSVQELTDKIAIFYNNHFLITIHKKEQPFTERIWEEEGRENNDCRLDNLVARLIWCALATFHDPAFVLDDQIDKYESIILLKNAKPKTLQGLYYIRRKAEIGRRLLLLSDDLILFLGTTDADRALVQDLRDAYTKLLALYEEILGDTNSLMTIYLSLTSQKTNDVVKLLTIFSVFFLPLTFIVGVYGMNFEYMPELRQRWGYPAVMGLMGVLVVAIFLWFKKRRWL